MSGALLFRFRRRRRRLAQKSREKWISPLHYTHSLTTLAAGGRGGEERRGEEGPHRSTQQVASAAERSAGWRNLCLARSASGVLKGENEVEGDEEEDGDAPLLSVFPEMPRVIRDVYLHCSLFKPVPVQRHSSLVNLD